MSAFNNGSNEARFESIAEAVLWLLRVPSSPGTNYFGFSRRKGRGGTAPHGWRQIAVFPTGRAGAPRTYHCRLSPDRADEGSGGWHEIGRHSRRLFELESRSRRVARHSAGLAQWRVPTA